jgi:ABC-2 type transport system ATP-binding protein
MKIITGYLGQDGGEVAVCGIPVKQRPLDSRKKIGYLPEANPLYPDMYVREYLDFIADVHAIPCRKEKIGSVIDTVGLAPESKKRLGQLSKGYKQRVGLAAALLHDPEVLILDEPTSGLDPNQIIEIRDTIKKLGENKTVLFSSHILQEVEALCDRVVIINKGKLIADSPLSQLRKANEGNAVRVAFKETLDASQLQTLKDVTAVRQLSVHEWELTAAETGELKKQLLELALQNNWNIVSLQSENRSLEEIFRHLTT